MDKYSFVCYINFGMRHVLLLTLLSLFCARAADTQFGHEIVPESTPSTSATIGWKESQTRLTTEELWNGLKTLQFTNASAPTTGARELAFLIRTPTSYRSDGSADLHRHNPHDDPTQFAAGVPEVSGLVAVPFMAAIVFFTMQRRRNA